MPSFIHDNLSLTYFDEGEPAGDPILLIHGFASNKEVNWVNPGWLKTLGDAGYRVIAIDNRGHGESDKPHGTEAYVPERMADDAIALLRHLEVPRAHVMGYSMGARISAFMALAAPEMVRSLVFGGLGMGMVEGVGSWEGIAEGLLADSIDTVSDPRARAFRLFADQTGSDRIALAACIRSSRRKLTAEQVRKIEVPAMIAVGTKDDIAGSPHELAALLPRAQVVEIPGRDHMLAVGDRVFKQAVLEFLASNH
ncbi:alpha/beta fold hydrolase [Oricola thermophila]|uniref:Alpha/beta hydrolase n=1 Tax=Oricola thermophila TaxID=2742145 RepID=A0A6N1VI40_9HYPH|nr:alpha/beta hydrolase [Oricola thermophila]QKV20550.1 alpha/beta hydrolase [Oricola thermophila]